MAKHTFEILRCERRKIFKVCMAVLQHDRVNPFHATKPLQFPLKTLENQRLHDVFRGYRKRSAA